MRNSLLDILNILAGGLVGALVIALPIKIATRIVRAAERGWSLCFLSGFALFLVADAVTYAVHVTYVWQAVWIVGPLVLILSGAVFAFVHNTSVPRGLLISLSIVPLTLLIWVIFLNLIGSNGHVQFNIPGPVFTFSS